MEIELQQNIHKISSQEIFHCLLLPGSGVNIFLQDVILMEGMRGQIKQALLLSTNFSARSDTMWLSKVLDAIQESSSRDTFWHYSLAVVHSLQAPTVKHQKMQ